MAIDTRNGYAMAVRYIMAKRHCGVRLAMAILEIIRGMRNEKMVQRI